MSGWLCLWLFIICFSLIARLFNSLLANKKFKKFPGNNLVVIIIIFSKGHTRLKQPAMEVNLTVVNHLPLIELRQYK